LLRWGCLLAGVLCMMFAELVLVWARAANSLPWAQWVVGALFFVGMGLMLFACFLAVRSCFRRPNGV